MKTILNFFNKYRVRIIFGFLCIFILIVLYMSYSYLSYFLNICDKFKSEYESLNDEMTEDGKEYPKVKISGSGIIKYSSIDDVLDILDDGYGVIYFGSAGCLYCRSAVQVLMDTALDTELKELYYLDISKVWDIKKLDDNGKIVSVKEASNGYDKLLQELGDEYLIDYIVSDNTGRRVDAEEKRLNVPLVVFVVDGNIVSSRIGTLFSQTDPYTPLDNSQVKGLSEIYRSGIEDVLKGIQNINK